MGIRSGRAVAEYKGVTIWEHVGERSPERTFYAIDAMGIAASTFYPTEQDVREWIDRKIAAGILTAA